MIRRSASLVGTGQLGYVLGWYIQVDSSDNQSMVMTFEQTLAGNGGSSTTAPAAGTCTIQPANNIIFTDGSPASIPEIE